MTASVVERIAAAVYQALLAEPRIVEVLGRVERAREEPFSREEVGDGAINIKSRDERMKVFSEEIDECELDVDVEINVRTADVWETAADNIARQVHTRVIGFNYTAAGLRIARTRKVARSPSSDDGDYTPGQLTLTYTFRYFTLANDITEQP